MRNQCCFTSYLGDVHNALVVAPDLKTRATEITVVTVSSLGQISKPGLLTLGNPSIDVAMMSQ